jgi:hypothetical protein
MVWQIFWRPVGYFGIGAIFMIFYAIFSFNPAFEMQSPLFWATCLLVLETLRQIVAFYYGSPPQQIDNVSVPRWKTSGLCLLSFAVPPIGLISWLTLDNKKPLLARRVGRSAVRGALVLGVAGYFATTTWLVNTAIKAIDLAHLKPYNQARIDRMRQEKLVPREASLPPRPKI